MTEIQVDQRVQLMQDIPELGLRCGEVGIVCTRWHIRPTAYEVEFQRNVSDCLIRALLMSYQITGEPQRH